MQSETEYHIEIIIKSDPSTYIWGVFIDFFNRERTPTYPTYIHGDQTRKKGDDGNIRLFFANWEVVEASEDENIWRSPIAKISIQQYPSSQTIVFVDRLKGAELDWPKVESIMREFITRLEILNFEVLRVTPVNLLPKNSAQLLMQPTKLPEPETPKNIFRKSGNVWELKFQNCNKFNLADLNGLSYIYFLLRYPNKGIHVTTLESKFGDGPNRVSQDTDFEDEFNSDTGQDFDAVDPRYKKESQDRLHEIISERIEAESKGDYDALEKLDNETEDIKMNLTQSTGLGGKSRKMPSDHEKSRQRVTKAIKKALEKIENEGKCLELAQYLEKSISTGIMCEYKPPDKNKTSDWIFK